jgi:hypothetical protein
LHDTLATLCSLVERAGLELEETNEVEPKKFEERGGEAEKLDGEADMAEAIRDKANYLTKIDDKVGLRLALQNVNCTYAT